MIAAMVASVAGCLATVFCLLSLRKSRAAFLMESERLREAHDRALSTCSAQKDELRREFARLALSMQNTEELVTDGRLSRTKRAQALRLLRTGVAPATAASTLGMARHEMELLSKVSFTLLAP
jgi:hypothetical protein